MSNNVPQKEIKKFKVHKITEMFAVVIVLSVRCLIFLPFFK